MYNWIPSRKDLIYTSTLSRAGILLMLKLTGKLPEKKWPSQGERRHP